ncbi:MAG TPA: protein phosphatase 2C domain-containing protein [Planctomycetota bacterium]|nr:protein phosphatase 2C domain-containing protein [Planctomycetota bacterium]
MRLVCAGKTDVGRKRHLNEDSFYASDEYGFCVLADGMGGRDFGEVASSLCVSSFNTYFRKHFPETFRGRPWDGKGLMEDLLRVLFDGWVREVNTAVFNFGMVDSRYREMGTTLAFLYHQEDFVVTVHVGDSRVYRRRAGEMKQVTDDHSFINSQLKAKLITPEEAALSSHKNIITRAIGTRPYVKPEVRFHDAAVGDVYLLCSDGLSDLVSSDDMSRALERNGTDLSRALDELVDLANERGGKDNITVVLARVDEGAAPRVVGAAGGNGGGPK